MYFQNNLLKIVFKCYTRSKTGNVFISLDDANKALDEMLRNKTFNRLPIGSYVYSVNRINCKIEKYTLINRTVNFPQTNTLSLRRADGILYNLTLGTTRFETRASCGLDAHYRCDIPYSLVLFTDGDDAKKYVSLLKKRRENYKHR